MRDRERKGERTQTLPDLENEFWECHSSKNDKKAKTLSER